MRILGLDIRYIEWGYSAWAGEVIGENIVGGWSEATAMAAKEENNHDNGHKAQDAANDDSRDGWGLER